MDITLEMRVYWNYPSTWNPAIEFCFATTADEFVIVSKGAEYVYPLTTPLRAHRNDFPAFINEVI